MKLATTCSCPRAWHGGYGRRGRVVGGARVSWIDRSRLEPSAHADGEASEGGVPAARFAAQARDGRRQLTLRPHVGWKRTRKTCAGTRTTNRCRRVEPGSGDHSVISGSGLLARDNSLNTELADTGILTGGSLRRSKEAALAWSHEQSDRTELGRSRATAEIRIRGPAFLHVLRTSSSHSFAAGLSVPSVSVTQSHQWSPRTSFDLAPMQQADFAGDTDDSDSYDAHLGFNRALTSRIGCISRRACLVRPSSSSSESGYIGRFELTRMWVCSVNGACSRGAVFRRAATARSSREMTRACRSTGA